MKPQLPGIDRPKRNPPRIMAKLVDAGGEGAPMAHYVCKKCGWDSGWRVDRRSTTEIRRGIPCDACARANDEDAAAMQEMAEDDMAHAARDRQLGL